MKAIGKLSLVVIVFGAGLSGMPMRAEAQNYPWCAQYGGKMGGAMNCGFVSFDQCMQTVRGMGGFCMANNTYQPSGPAHHSRRPKRHAPHRSS
ncbi:MAG: DUF3551 domain-containing protein [Xanthobacteraceae bacterium]